MHSVHNAVRRGSLRLLLALVLRRACVTLPAAIAALAAARLVLWLVGVPLALGPAVTIALAAAAATALVWALLTRPRGAAVAHAIDQGAHLREALSTAWAIRDREDPWSAAVREHAQHRASAVDLRSALPVSLPARWRLSPIAAAAAALLWLVLPATSPDLLGWVRRERQQAQAEQDLRQAKEAADEAQRIASKVAERTGRPLDELGEMTDPQSLSPEALRLAALERLTSARDALREEVTKSERARQLQAVREELARMRQPAPGPATEFARELSKGDFTSAAEQLGKLSEQLASGEMSKADRQAMAQQLEAMQSQLEKLAADKNQLQQALQQAGMSPQEAAQAAADPAALQRALDQMQSLSAEQRQQLLDQAQQMAAASQSMGQMSQAMGQLAQQMSQGQSGQQTMQAMSDMQGMVGELDMLQQEMMQAQAMLGQAQAQMAALGQGQGQGQGQSLAALGLGTGGSSNQRGAGSGIGSGSALANNDDPSQTDVQTKTQRSPTRLGQGPIVAQRLVYGEQVRGESVAQFSQAVQAASTGVAKAVEESLIPIEWQDAAQAYFGRLEQRAQVVRGETSPQADPKPAPQQQTQPEGP